MSSVSNLNYHKRISLALGYIEKNLQEPLNLDNIAAQACYSRYHFSRIFSAIAGISIQEYIRKRRIIESAGLLIRTDMSIYDIALDFQFDSQEAYSRAFKRVYKTSPGKFRKQNEHVMAESPFSWDNNTFYVNAKNITMEPRFISVPNKKFIGMHTQTSLSDNTMPQLWQKFMPRVKEIGNLADPGNYYAIFPYHPDFLMDNFDEHSYIQKWAAVEVRDFDSVPEGMLSYEFTGGKYAVFTYKGLANQFHTALDYIFAHWLPQSEYELDMRDEFELIGNKYYGPNHLESELDIYIPIV